MISKRHLGVLRKLADQSRYRSIVVFVFAFAVIGGITLLFAHASAPGISVEPEILSSIASPAVSGSDSTASNNSYVQFKKSSSSGVSNIPVPTSGAYFGILMDAPYALTKNDRIVAITDAETEIGRKFDFERQFYKWGDNPIPAADNPSPTPNGYLAWSSSTGGNTMFINLVAANRSGSRAFTSWNNIANNTYGDDANYLIPLAKDIKEWGKPAFFDFQHEPEPLLCDTDALKVPDESLANSCYGTAAEYIAAYQHIFNVFHDQGVNNLSYVWATTAFRWSNYVKPTSAHRYSDVTYPGAGYVDWIAVDPFNFATSTWQEMSTMVAPWYTWAETQTPKKPLMIGAFGSLLQDSTNPTVNNRTEWFNNAKDYISARPDIKALMTYNNNPSGNASDDWYIFANKPPQSCTSTTPQSCTIVPNLNFDTSSFNAYKTWANDSWFNTRNCNVISCGN